MATTARRSKIIRAFSWDVAGWLAPWFVCGLAVVLVPGVNWTVGGIVISLVLATCWTACNVAYDLHRLRQDGFTGGFGRHGLRVIDPKKDHFSHLARHPKKLRKLIRGEYEILDIGPKRR